MPVALLNAGAYNNSVAKRDLAKCLRESELALMLGSGVSLGLGLPSWDGLVADLLAINSMPPLSSNPTPDELANAVTQIELSLTDPLVYLDQVRRVLYTKTSRAQDLLCHTKLIVLGAMLAASRRGHVSEVVTFNFDDILERYLFLHGFTWQSVYHLPEMRGGADVTIYHPHGLLRTDPTQRGSDSIVLSKVSFDRRMGDPIEPWRLLTQDLMSRKILLVNGLSTKGQNIGPLMDWVNNGIIKGSRPTAFWMLGPKDPATDDQLVRHWGAVPLRFSRYEEGDEFLLEICQEAAIL